jgi:hypothetical protein
MSRGSEYAKQCCNVCAEVCDACADECEKFSSVEECKQMHAENVLKSVVI